MIVDQLYRGPHQLWAQEMYVYRLELREALAESAIGLDEFPDPDPSADTPLREGPARPYRRNPEKVARHERIIEALCCDRSLADIAQEFGVTRQAISLIAIQNGLRRHQRRDQGLE